MSLKVVDLFCGAGGFSHGFQTEGFDIVLGVDNWKGCMKTYMHNHPKTDFLLMDINELDPDTLPKADVILGSPPCTNFSVVNPHRDESKGFALIDVFLKIIEECEPKYWIMENVPNKALIDHLNGFPYMVVRCSDFGLRTMRRRLFAGQFPQPMSMGSRPWRLNKDVYPTIKATNNLGYDDKRDYKKVWDRRGIVFGSIPANPRKGVGQYAWQHEQWEKRGVVFPSVNTKDHLTQMKKTDWEGRGVVYPSPTTKSLDAMGKRKVVDRWKDYGVLPTVSGRNVVQRGATGSKEAFQKRGVDVVEFTPEFAAWVQTFPDDFKFIGSKTSKYKMIGNAVPPEMSRILARAIKEDYE